MRPLIVVTADAVWRLNIGATDKGYFNHYPEVVEQLSRGREGIIDVTTVKLLFPEHLVQPEPGMLAHGLATLSDRVDWWLNRANCNTLGIGFRIEPKIKLLASHLITMPQDWSFVARLAHLIVHLGTWPAGNEALWAGVKLEETIMDSNAQTPDSPNSQNERRLFWGVNVGPNAGSFRLKIALIANISVAILSGDKLAQSISVKRWKMLMQEPETTIDAGSDPWRHFLGFGADSPVMRSK